MADQYIGNVPDLSDEQFTEGVFACGSLISGDYLVAKLSGAALLRLIQANSAIEFQYRATATDDWASTVLDEGEVRFRVGSDSEWSAALPVGGSDASGGGTSIAIYATLTAYEVDTFVLGADDLLYHVSTAVAATNTTAPADSTSFTCVGVKVVAGDGISITQVNNVATIAVTSEGGPTDIHEDYTTELTELAAADRFIGSDESDTDDPTKWLAFSTLVSAILKGGLPIVPVAAANVTHTADAIVIEPTTPLTAYANGVAFFFRSKAANTGNVTLAVSALATRQLRNQQNSQFAAGELRSGAYVLAVYYAINSRFVAANIVPRPSEQEVYDHLENILTAGTNITLTPVDSTRRITIASTAAGGTGDDDQTAEEVQLTSDSFSGYLSSTDVNVQLAFDTLDGITISLSRQDENRLEQIPRLGVLTGDMRQKDVARVWEAPANSAHGLAVFSGLTTPTDSEIESATYVTPLETVANTTTRILVVKVDLGDNPGDIRVRETGLPAGAVYDISGSLFYPLHSDTLYDYYAHDVRVQNERTFVLEEHELPDGHTAYRGEVRGDQTKITSADFTRILATTVVDVQKLAVAVDGLKVPTDNTLTYNSSDELVVNVQDVIEHLQERIRYYTSANTYGSAGASVGQVYTTSPYRKLITKVEVNFDPLAGADSFLVRLVELEDNNEIKAKLHVSNTRSGPFGAGSGVRAFTFHNAAGEVGVTIDKSIRLGILLSRLGDDSDSSVEALHGSEASASPNETYDDASMDFELVNDVVYNHINPAVGASTHSHGSSIRGNIKIFYTLIVDHGQYVGADNVGVDHIDSGDSDNGEVITSDGAGGATWEEPAAGGASATQRRESVTFQAASSVDAGTVVSPIATNAIDVVYPPDTTTRQILNAGSNADGFEVAQPGLYIFTWDADANGGVRSAPACYIYNYADTPGTDAPIGFTATDYLRYASANSDVRQMGFLQVDAADTAVKLVLLNPYGSAGAYGAFGIEANAKFTIARLGDKGDKGDIGDTGPSGDGPPASIWWMTAADGTAQTERLPVTAPQILLEALKVPRFSSTASESFNGGVSVTWSNANADSDADIQATDLPDCVFELEAGTYHIKFVSYTDSQSNSAVAVALRSAQSGTDDVIVIHRPGFATHNTISSVNAEVRTIFDVKHEYFVLAVAKKFYWQFYASEAGLPDKASGYMQIEKV